jgi:ParB-like chromosome segregation protein Spo0J
LIPYANNARLHSAADLDKIAASIRKWGWTMPVLADEEGAVIAGHARIRAAAKLGLTFITVIVVRGRSEDESRGVESQFDTFSELLAQPARLLPCYRR